MNKRNHGATMESHEKRETRESLMRLTVNLSTEEVC
jgi:hypothetical protein